MRIFQMQRGIRVETLFKLCCHLHPHHFTSFISLLLIARVVTRRHRASTPQRNPFTHVPRLGADTSLNTRRHNYRRCRCFSKNKKHSLYRWFHPHRLRSAPPRPSFQASKRPVFSLLYSMALCPSIHNTGFSVVSSIPHVLYHLNSNRQLQQKIRPTQQSPTLTHPSLQYSTPPRTSTRTYSPAPT